MEETGGLVQAITNLTIVMEGINTQLILLREELSSRRDYEQMKAIELPPLIENMVAEYASLVEDREIE